MYICQLEILKLAPSFFLHQINLIMILALSLTTHGVVSTDLSPFPLENSVLAEPRVDCGIETISVWIRTEKPFHGRLYVEDESERQECVHSYAKKLIVGKSAEEGRRPSPIDESRGAEFSIRFGQCNMRRQRLLNPRGVTYSFTLVISFHPVFLTGIDRAFNIKCFFMEAVKALDTALDVRPLTTSVVERHFMLPQCSYNLKHGLDGPLLKYASIGEPITHVWQCDPVAGWLYGVLIHSCFVDDGHGSRFDLIDDRGCVTDPSLLAEIIYNEKSFTAYAHTHVFRYADRVQLFFTCTVQLCFREDGGCDGISPPNCSHTRSTISSSSSKPISQAQNFPSRLPFRKLPSFHGNHHQDESEFSGNPLSLKDSPLSQTKHNKNINNQTKIVEQLLINNKSSSISENLKVNGSIINHNRAGRNAAAAGLNGQMETDLSADLTVVPRTSDGIGIGQIIMKNNGNGRQVQMAMLQSSERNPFIRVLPIKNDEYNGRSMSVASSLDSQRFSSFEMLTIAGAIFVAAVIVTSLITTFCLHHFRLRTLLAKKSDGVMNNRSEVIMN